MAISQTKVKDELAGVLDELAPDRRVEVLEFALFLKARQVQQNSEDLGDSTEDLENDSRYPLRGTVVRYEDPLTPVAQADWETLQ